MSNLRVSRLDPGTHPFSPGGRFDDAASRWFGHSLPPRRVLLGKVLARTLAVLLALGVGYVLVANWALTKIEGWASGESFTLTYDGAHTLWPGRVVVENLCIRTSDSNVQIELRVARAKVDVSLLDLASKRFHALSAETHGTEFRLRHKHAEVGDAAPRIAAYPPIEGFEGPPLRDVGPPTPLGETWTIRMENVTAAVTRLWFVEYHYHGPALAEGAFELHPGRFLELEPSTLRFGGGALQVGDDFVARKLDGTVHARIEPTNIEPIEGSAIFFPITTRVDIELAEGDLAFTEIYTRGQLPLSLRGPLGGMVRGGLIQGALTPDTRVELSSGAATIRAGTTQVTGDWSFRLDVDTERSPGTFRLSATSRTSVASGDRAPRLQDVRASVALRPLEMYEPLRRERFALSISALEVPDFGWFESLLDADGVELEGKGRLQLDYADDASKGTSGDVAVVYEDFELSKKGLDVGLSGRADGRFVSEPNALVAMRAVRCTVKRGTLELDDERWDSWSLVARSNSARLLKEPLAFQSTLDVNLTRGGGLAELVLPDLPAKLATSLFNIEDIQGRLAIYVDERQRRVEVLNAVSGDVRASGVWASTPSKTEGAISLETPIADFQILLD